MEQTADGIFVKIGYLREFFVSFSIFFFDFSKNLLTKQPIGIYFSYCFVLCEVFYYSQKEHFTEFQPHLTP